MLVTGTTTAVAFCVVTHPVDAYRAVESGAWAIKSVALAALELGKAAYYNDSAHLKESGRKLTEAATATADTAIYTGGVLFHYVPTNLYHWLRTRNGQASPPSVERSE